MLIKQNYFLNNKRNNKSTQSTYQRGHYEETGECNSNNVYTKYYIKFSSFQQVMCSKYLQRTKIDIRERLFSYEKIMFLIC